MKCSIIIPYFQRKNLLINTLRSLDNQIKIKNDFEVILIDDGSNDLSLEDITSLNLSIKLSYHKYERSGLSGPSFARNRGIEHSTGELLIFLDCDQIVNNDFVYEHYKFFQKLPENQHIIQLGMRNYLKSNADINNIKEEYYFKDERIAIIKIYSQNFECMIGAWHLSFSCNISVPRETVAKYGGFDENFKGWGLEDCEFAYRLYKQGAKILYNPNIEVFHQHHEASFDEFRYSNWKNNLSYFIQKHYELPVMLQLIFCDYFDPVKRAQLQEKVTGDVWVYCYQRFEETLRYLDGVKGSLT